MENLLHEIISLVPAHVYWKNTQGIYLGCNELQAKRAGLSSAEEIKGKTDFDFLPLADAEKIRKLDKHIIKTGLTHTSEETVNLEGEEFIFLSRKAPLYDNKGKAIGIIGISIDITQQKQLNILKKDQAIASEKIQNLKSLAGSIAHEMRTPLAAICANLQSLHQSLPILVDAYKMATQHGLSKLMVPEDELTYLAQLSEKLKHRIYTAVNVVDMLLMNIREEILLRKEDLEICSIQHAVQATLQEYPFNEHERALVQVDGIDDFNYAGKTHLTKHILFNLLNNAFYFIKTANKGGIEIKLQSRKKYNELIFKDTAIGIPQTRLSQIFDQFTTTRPSGTGLGLPFCKKVMQSYGGDIRCESQEGKYTSFILTFPINL